MTYDVHAQAPLSCTCGDWTQQTTKGKGDSCKHLLATWLYRRALAQVAPSSPEAATGRHTQPTRAEKAAVLPRPEAAFSLCLQGRLAGQDAQLTVRGATYAEFAAHVAAVRGLLDAPDSQSFSHPDIQQAGQPDSRRRPPAVRGMAR